MWRYKILNFIYVTLNYVWKHPKKQFNWRTLTFHNLHSHLSFDISKYVYWLDSRSVKVWWRYMLPITNTVNLCDIFSDIEQCFQKPKAKNVSLGQSLMIYDISSNFYRPLHKLIKAESALQIAGNNRQNFKITDR